MINQQIYSWKTQQPKGCSWQELNSSSRYWCSCHSLLAVTVYLVLSQGAFTQLPDKLGRG